jgi:S1-C subfamily serine protease
MSSTSPTEILQTFSNAIQQVAESVSPSVVSIRSGEGNGTGIVWDDQGHIVTAYHVVRHLDEVQVTTDDGKTFSGKVVGRDKSSDIALLKVEGKLTPIGRADSDSLKVGQFVLALASPFGSKASATSGIITGVRRNIGGWWGVQIDDAIVTDARVNPGYSGGPLVDASGKMIGLNVALISSRGIAIPARKVSDVVEKIASGKVTRRGYLGIVSNPVPLPERATKLSGSNQEYGLLILSVEADSPADKTGLVLGDVLLGFGDSPVEGFHDLTHLLTEETIGKPVKLRILRGGRPEELSITPAAAPESVD